MFQKLKELVFGKLGPIPTVEEVFEKIRAELLLKDNAPRTRIGFGIWLATILSAEEFEALDLYEKQVGLEAANRRLGEVMESTGKYSMDDDGFAAPGKPSRRNHG